MKGPIMAINLNTLTPADIDGILAVTGRSDVALADRVRFFAGLDARYPGVSGRALAAHVSDVAGIDVSQTELSRALAVARAAVKSGMPLAADGADSILADGIRIMGIPSKHGGGAAVMRELFETFGGDIQRMADVVSDTLDFVRDNVAADRAERAAERDAEKLAESEKSDAERSQESAEHTAPRAADVVRSIAGDVESGRIAADDDLVDAAAALLAVLRDRAGIVTVRERTGDVVNTVPHPLTQLTAA